MAISRPFGPVQPLTYPHSCGGNCRLLCFEAEDPQGRLVRLTHGQWQQILGKLNRAQMDRRLGSVEATIREPREIYADVDERTLCYYSQPSGLDGKLLFVAVKCLPRRFQGGASQRRQVQIGRRLGFPTAGEAWVSSAYPLQRVKRRGKKLWP